jgi:hypothetical protein
MWYPILSIIFGIWVGFDGHKRKANFIVWAIGVAILGPIILPVYLAKRPLLSGQIREGGTAWNILKNFAIFWTIFMIVATVWTMSAIGERITTLNSEAARAGAAIGTFLGLGMLGVLWFLPFIGAFILGLMLKKNSIIERGPAAQSEPQIPLVVSAATKTKRWPIWAGVIVVGLILAYFIGSEARKGSAVKQSTPKQEQASLTTEEQKSAESSKPSEVTKPENWIYSESADEMGRGLIKGARTESINTVEFDFPYQGSQHGTLYLRSHPRYGKDILLSIQKGQFLSGIDGCKVLVRFDDGKPQTFRANKPSDHSSTTLFISNNGKFIAGLKQAKQVMIEAEFFHHGNKIFVFNVEGLKWETPPSKKR